MSWRSTAETIPLVMSFTNDIDGLWSVARFLTSAFYRETFEPSAEWASTIHLSAHGEAALALIQREVKNAPNHLVKFFLFRRFYQEELLIDCERTNAKEVESLLSSIWDTSEAKWPYIFGTELYNKFNHTYGGNRTGSLEASDVSVLLENTPHGIFQVGTLLSGPMGFLHSEQQRFTPPLLKMPLWHCSDVGCGALHTVEARQFNSPLTAFLRDASRTLSDHFGPRSEWGRALDKLVKGELSASGRLYADMPAIVCDCIAGTEIRTLSDRALRSAAGSRVRNLIATRRSSTGSPADVVSSLQPSECQQMLLLLKDFDLVTFLDELIARGQIEIPPTEVRSARTYVSTEYNDHKTHLSSLGVRTNFHPPMIRLQGEIWQAYSSINGLAELEWKICRTRGESSGLRIALMNYIVQNGPEETVQNLIFSSQLVHEQIEEKLQFKFMKGETEKESARKLLWKFGFSIPRYGSDQELLRNRMADFKSATLRMPLRPSEEDRAAVRSVGVNLFVSVEGFLEDLIAFNVWLITSDHFIDTRFKYEKTKALGAVSKYLDDFTGSGEARTSWNVSGANTLGILLAYLAALRNWLETRRTAESSSLKRESKDLPHYFEDPLWSFPFRHRELWADVPKEVLEEYIALIDNIHRQAVQADLPSVRNGLDHKRSDAEFPTADKMLACVSRLEEMFDLADHRSLIPKLVWETRSENDSSGNATAYLRDYKGDTIVMSGPAPTPNMRVAGFGVPYIAAPLNFLSLPNAHILFGVLEKSAYSDYWSGYPIRRFIPTLKNSPDAEPEMASV